MNSSVGFSESGRVFRIMRDCRDCLEFRGVWSYPPYYSHSTSRVAVYSGPEGGRLVASSGAEIAGDEPLPPARDVALVNRVRAHRALPLLAQAAPLIEVGFRALPTESWQVTVNPPPSPTKPRPLITGRGSRYRQPLRLGAGCTWLLGLYDLRTVSFSLAYHRLAAAHP